MSIEPNLTPVIVTELRIPRAGRNELERSGETFNS